MKIKYRGENLYAHEVLEHLKKDYNCHVESAEDLITLLFKRDCDYKLVRKWVEAPKQTVMNRINELWVYPLFILCMPTRYVLYGSSKVSEDSKLGKIITWLVGEMK